jgi:hypothetical protein
MKSRLNTGLARLRVKILKENYADPTCETPMRQRTAATWLDIPLATYVAYEKGARRIPGKVAKIISETWNVSLDYLMQKPPKGAPISVSGEPLTWKDARASVIRRRFGFDTWNGQHGTTELAELLLLNIHGAIRRLSSDSYYSHKKPARPPKRYRELRERLVSGEELSDTERSELETLGKKWARKKDTDFKRLRREGHEATEGFLFDALAAIRELLDKYHLEYASLPGFDTRYTPIMEEILQDPDAPIRGWQSGKEIEFQRTEEAELAHMDSGKHDRAMCRLRQKYHLHDDVLYEAWRPKLESLLRQQHRNAEGQTPASGV